MHKCQKRPHLWVLRWSEQLVVYPRTNKQNQKKKRKVEPTTSQVILLYFIRKGDMSLLDNVFPFFLFHCVLTSSCVYVQEPGPAKVAVTGSGIPEAEKVPDSSSIIWQEELNQREAEGAAVWANADIPPGSPLPSTGKDE